MATVTFGNIGTRPYGVLEVNETATSTANNTSNISIKLTLKRPYEISSSATKTATCTVNGRVFSWSGSVGGSGDLVLISQTMTITHNSDGTKTIPMSASITLDIAWSGQSIGTIRGTGTLTLTALPVNKPAIGTITYKDYDETTIAITGDNQTVVQNKSLVQFNVSGIVVYNSTVKSVTIAVNGQNHNMVISGSTASIVGVRINSASNVTATITVTDSRGLSSSKSVTVKMVAYSNPTAVITAERQNNYYTPTSLTVNAGISEIGSNAVTITYVAVDDSGTLTRIAGSLTDGVATVVDLNNNYSWTVTVTLIDSFTGTSTYKVHIPRGLPIIYFDNLKSSVGINCFPQGENTLEVNGVDVMKSIMTLSMESDLTNLTVKSYTAIPLDTEVSFGDKLTMTSDGGIKIGAGVSMVKISAMMSMSCSGTTGTRYLRVAKNGSAQTGTLGWAYGTMNASTVHNLSIPPFLVSVNEGDIIRLYYYAQNTADLIGGNAVPNGTILTVETI